MSYKLELAKDHQIRVLVCSPKATLPAMMAQFTEQLKSQSAFSLVQLQQFSEIAEHIPAEPVGSIVVLCLQDKDEFVQVLQFLTTNETRIQQGIMKVITFSRVDHPRVLSMLKSKGVSDIPEFSISLKAFGYKIKNASQMIEQAIENAKRQVTADGQNAAMKARNTGGGHKSSASYKVQWEKPIEHFSDFWLVLNQRHARYVIGKWMVNFYGPGPSTGNWELTELEMNGEKGWKFQPRVSTDTTFYKDEGRWVFFGNCPEFSWEQRLWYFISKRPAFYFYVGQEILHKKLAFQESGDVSLCTNSAIGKSMKDTIASTIEASIRLHTDREKKKGNVVFENDIKQIKEMSTDLDPENVTEFDYRGKADDDGTDLDYRGKIEDGNELNGRFSSENSKEVQKAEEAYESAELKISITSKNGVKLELQDPLKLIELRENQAIIDIPFGLLVAGDEIELIAHLQEGKKTKKVNFSATTKIVESELTDGEVADQKRAAAICELNEPIKTHFTDVVDQLQAKRELLDQFFKKAKGA